MEPDGSLPHSQLPATCPYPEQAQSSPYPHILLPEDPSQYYFPSTPGSPKWSLFLGFPHQNSINASLIPIRATCLAHLILLESLHLTSFISVTPTFTTLMLNLTQYQKVSESCV
jgi:hypothetical protein